MKKKLISLLLAVVMVLSVMPLTFAVSAATASPEANDVQSATPTTDTNWYDNETGDDTPNDLYIYNEDDFMAFGAKLASNPNTGASDTYFAGKVVHIVSDLDFDEYNFGNASRYWMAIIKRGRAFSGIIDGHGHTIENLIYICEAGNAGNKDGGLLGGILLPHSSTIGNYGVNAGVFNLKIKNCSVSSPAEGIGGLFGAVNGTTGTVALCNLDVNVKATATGNYVGGLIGRVLNTNILKISNCVVSGEFDVAGYAGGYVGFDTNGNTQYINCISKVNIKATGLALGGFVGAAQPRTTDQTCDKDFINSIYTGSITRTSTSADSFTGGIIGRIGAINDSNASLKGIVSIDKCASYGVINFVNNTGNRSGGLVGGTVDKKVTVDTVTTRYSSLSEITITNSVIGGSISATASGGNFAALVGYLVDNTKLNASNVISFMTRTVANAASDHKWRNAADTTDATMTGYKTTTASAMNGMNATVVDGFTATPAYYPVPYGVAKYYAAEINDAEAIGTSTSIVGHQRTDYVDSKCDLRLIGLVHGENTAYDAVGFEFVIVNEAGATRTNVVDGAAPAITTVYTSVLEPDIDTATGEQKTDPDTGDKLYVSTSAETLGGDYIFVTTISPMVANKGIVTVIVKSFHDVGDARVYDDIMVINFDTTENS